MAATPNQSTTSSKPEARHFEAFARSACRDQWIIRAFRWIVGQGPVSSAWFWALILLAPLVSRQAFASVQGKQDDARSTEGQQSEAELLRQWFDEALADYGVKRSKSEKSLVANPLVWSDAESGVGAGALGAAPLGAAGGGGSGGGGSGGGSATLSQTPVASAGTVVKGYLTKAVVWRDLNNNGRFDWVDTNRNGSVEGNEVSADAFVISNDQGKFEQLPGRGAIRVFGGTDLYGTGLDFKGQLLAPNDSVVVTPITTLIELVRRAEETGPQAALRLKNLLGLPGAATAQDLLSIDPIAEALSQSEKSDLAIELYADAAKIANYLLAATEWLNQAYRQSGLSIDSSEAAQAVFSATASVLNSSPSFSFERVSDLSIALHAISKYTPASVNWTQVIEADLLARVLGSVASKFDGIVANASSAKQALIGLAQTEYLIQNDLLLALGQEPELFPVSSFEGLNLDRRLAEISEVVGPVSGPAPGQRGLAGRPDAALESGQILGPGQVLFDENDLNGGPITFSVKLANADPKVGDRLILLLEGKEVVKDIITDADVRDGFAKTELDGRIFSGLPENQLLRLVARIDSPEGVQGLTSRALQVFLDTKVPTPSPFLVSEDSGNPGDSITYMPPILKIGDIERGARIDIEVFRGSDSLGIVKLNQSGEFTTSLETLLSELPKPQPIVDGNYRLSLVQFDTAGHQSPAAEISVVLDQTAPVISLQATSVAINPQLTKEVPFPAFADEEVIWTADLIDLPDSGSPILAITDGMITGDFKSLKDGDYGIQLIAKDLAGNENFAEFDLVIDRNLKVSAADAERSKGLSVQLLPSEESRDGSLSSAAISSNLEKNYPIEYGLIAHQLAEQELQLQLTVLDTMKAS